MPMSDDQGTPQATAAALAANSDTFMVQLERLAELEQRKRDLPPNDPRFVALAVEVEDAAKALLQDARDQTALGDVAHAAGLSVPIVEVPNDLTAAQIIAEWRDVERRLSSLPPASDEAREARLMIDAYRRAYQAAFTDRQKKIQ
jgi:hypothetical protein